MDIVVRVEPTGAALPGVEYRWDADTDILTATVRPLPEAKGMSGSVEIEGQDGSWLILDVRAGSIVGVEVAVWPKVRTVAALTLPANVSSALVTIPSRSSQPGIAALEVETRLAADANASESTIHFRIGGGRPARTVRVAEDLIVDLDDRERMTGVWLLNVPPFPSDP